MSGLQRFEQRLENMISGAFARAFRSAVQPVEIVSALQRECDNNAHILSRERRLVPNHFHVELSPTDSDRLSTYDTAMNKELVDQLQAHAKLQSYTFAGPVKIEFSSADDLTTGRFRVRSQAQARVTGTSTDTQFRRARAMLVVNGTEHPLTGHSLVIGRGTDADLRINDPGISRRHAEFILTQSGDEEPTVEVHDMGSTNGIKVDGRKQPRSVLSDGSTVRVGNTTLTLRIVRDDAAEDRA